MSFQPVLPLGGYAGWTFLKRTIVRQQAVQQAAPEAQRDEAYFRSKIGKVATAEQLVSDKRLLRISLAAFGLEVGDIILSGSPRPPASTKRSPLKPGDTIESMISSVGALTNRIVADEMSSNGPLRTFGTIVTGYV